MAEKDQQVYPMPQPYGPTKRDEESGTTQSKELRKKKRMKCAAYIVAFAVFQTGIILLFALTIMKIRTPKFLVRSATFDRFEVGTATNSTFNLRMSTELGVKNTNFGHFKFGNSTIQFFYRDVLVGEATVPKARARARSTKKLTVVVDLISTNVSDNASLGTDFSSGLLPLRSRSNLRGKVELMKVMKKKKSTNMDCTMTVSLTDRAIRDLKCN